MDVEQRVQRRLVGQPSQKIGRCEAGDRRDEKRDGVLSETVATLHEMLLGAFGGAAGVRDPGLLDSALARPLDLFADGTPTAFDLAASYAYGIVQDHPFIDGNKRTGFTLALVFLELNGWRFTANEADATVRTLALATGEIGESD
jgi:death-on-curing protein